jgi:hypothetical protein
MMPNIPVMMNFTKIDVINPLGGIHGRAKKIVSGVKKWQIAK